MIGCCKHSQVLYPVIVFIAVDMMDFFTRSQIATYIFLHHNTMFKHLSMFVSVWVVWSINIDVSITVDCSAAFPCETIRAFWYMIFLIMKFSTPFIIRFYKFSTLTTGSVNLIRIARNVLALHCHE